MRIPRLPKLALFSVASIVFGGILTQLASEFGGMGADPDDVLLSTQHFHLAIAALACAAICFYQLRRMSKDATNILDLKRILSLELSRLPLRGWSRYAAVATLQFAIGTLSAVAEDPRITVNDVLVCLTSEDSPFSRHNLVISLLGALLTVVFLALLSHVIVRRLPSVARALEPYLQRSVAAPLNRRRSIDAEFTLYTRFFWFNCLFNRPPPALQF